MLFRLEDVYKSYGAQDVLRGLTLQVNPRERIGLVGRNGAGKTTILRLVTGHQEADRGLVVVPKGIRLGVLEQQPVFKAGTRVRDEALGVFNELRSLEVEMARLEELMGAASGDELNRVMHDYSDLRHQYEMAGGFSYHTRAESVLFGLGFSPEDLERPAAELSGGQKARLALAKLLLAEPDLLLLDEPTNHLDVAAVEWLEDFLSEYRSAFVIVSHDRFLLDRTVTKIVEVAGGQATVYQGNYSAFVRQRDQRRQTQTRLYNQQQELIARTEEFIRRNIAGQKTKQAKSRRKMLARLDRVQAVRDERTGSFGFDPVAQRGAGAILSVKELSIGYPQNAVATGISLLLQKGESLGIIGPNGTGKTTFLRTIMGALEPLAGQVVWGAHAQLGYYDQELNNLDPRSSVLEELMALGPRSRASEQAFEGELRNYLARFLFIGDDVFKPVSALSGGELGRLALAKLIYLQPSVLVLDEPTNHLDIASREALEAALSEYGGTIIVVSHDRYFLDKIATEILYFEKGRAIHHAGTYSAFYATHHVRQAQEPPLEEKRRPPRYEPRSASAARKEVARPIGRLEQEIALVERELTDLSTRLANPSPDLGREQLAEMGVRHQSLSKHLEQLYKEWERLAGAT